MVTFNPMLSRKGDDFRGILSEERGAKEEWCPENSCIEFLVIWSHSAKSSGMSFPLVSVRIQSQGSQQKFKK
jgi:hypothetical protein